MTGKILRISYLVAISALLASALLFFGVMYRDYEDGAFAVTDPLGQQTVATISGDEISFTYNYSQTSALNQAYKGSVSALEAAVENMTGGEQ